MTQHYVITKDVREAVHGREADILSALGIAWSAGKRPATCPYPDHDDANPSWRWDDDKQKAFCNCRRPQNIFGVVEAMHGGDFDDAKLYVVETLGRKDLIREKRGQSMAPGALLKPPAKLRDENLPIKYLASRLGIEAEGFQHSHLGQYISARVDNDLDKFTQELIATPPSEIARCVEIRNNILVRNLFVLWIKEAIHSGLAAEYEQKAIDEPPD